MDQMSEKIQMKIREMIITATKFEVTTGAIKALTTLKEQAIWHKNLHKDVLSEI